MSMQIADNSNKSVAPCLLDKTTQNLIKLIFDNNMFKAALQEFDIDTKKMPLGKLSKAQIAKGNFFISENMITNIIKLLLF